MIVITMVMRLVLMIVIMMVMMIVMMMVMMMVMKMVMTATWLNIGLEKLVACDFSAASSRAASTAFCKYDRDDK